MKINLDKNILKLIDLLHSYDAHCYITGGFVRDQILGRDSVDIDIEVHNVTEEKLEEIISEEYNYHKFSRFGIYRCVEYARCGKAFSARGYGSDGH